MRFLHFSSHAKPNYPVCFLVPRIHDIEIRQAYVQPFGLDPDDLLVMDLYQNPTNPKKTSAQDMRQYITEELMPVFEDFAVEYLVVTDAKYFKILTKTSNVDLSLGYVLASDFGPQKVIYIPNYQSIFYDPVKVKAKIAQGIEALKAHQAGTYTPPGNGIMQQAHFPKTDADIAAWLEKLLAMNCPLTIDIEAFGLKHYSAGIGSIAFAWSQHEGVAFAVDYEEVPVPASLPWVDAADGKAPFGVNRRGKGTPLAG
jgi:DNA polymerase-1